MSTFSVTKPTPQSFALLIYSKDQLEDSRTVLAQIKEYDYNMDPDVYEAIVRLKEKVQYADLKAHPTQAKCDTYFKDFPTNTIMSR